MAVRIKDKAAVTEVDSSDRFAIDGTAGLRSWSWVNLVAGLKSGTKLASGLTTTFFQDVLEKGANDGYASLDSSGTVPVAQISSIATINTQTGTAYTLVLTDAGVILQTNNGSANTVTIPPTSSVALPVGTNLDIVQIGAGTTTVVAGSGVTANGTLVSAGQWKKLSLYKRSTDVWVVIP